MKGDSQLTALYEYRKKQAMTQKKLAKAIDVAQSTIAQYETGTRKPDIVTLKKLAIALHCTTDQLLEPIKNKEDF